ncbi:cellulose synthase subunit BcsC-related outer membrane protein [Marinospirillum perlucidum]|uniref:cellulose synthase subunit BcsC-related outer membrane protein n=1 Tax=Marinospirillum perlucidum TaxID=1982602 RepID=UPI000DF4C9B0|nr:cellulose synthase subunit BcsC-related outer membrane protein [Marinospirillum perlucidum]
MTAFTRLLLLFGSLLLAAEVLASQPDLLEHQQHPETNEREVSADYYLRPEQPQAQPPENQQVDTTGIWYHLRQGRLSAARAEWLRLRQENPGWQTPADLQAAFARANRPSATTPEGPPPDPYLLAMGRLASLAANELDRVESAHLNDLGRQALTRERSDHLLLLGWIHLERSEPLLARDRFLQAGRLQASAPVSDGLATAYYQLALVALANEQSDELLEAARQSYTWGREGIYAELGWQAFDQEKWQQAYLLFAQAEPRESELFGRYLALQRLQRLDEARDLACLHREKSQRLREACYNLEVQLAWQAYDAGDYELARQGFDRLLLASPASTDLAEALEYTLQRLGQPQAWAVARERHPLLRAASRQQVAALAWARKQFDLATRLNGETGAGADWILSSGLHFRAKAGDTGTTRLQRLQGYLGASRLWKDWRLGVRLLGDHVDSGLPPAGSRFGSGSLTAANQTRALADNLAYSPEISLRQEEATFNLQASLRSLHATEAASGQLYASLKTDLFPAFGFLSARLFRQEVSDSLLSLHGAVDPADSSSWGTLADQGISLLGVFSLPATTSLAVSGSWGEVTGERVAANPHQNLRLDLSWNRPQLLPGDRLDYLRLGPFVEYSQWDKNLSGFAVQEGGYFSPQTYWRAGVQLQLLTLEKQNWQLASQAQLSWNASTEEGVSGDTENNGLGGDLLLEGSYRVAPHLLVGGYFQQAFAPDYQDSRLGLVLRVPLDARGWVISRDLPTSQAPGH